MVVLDLRAWFKASEYSNPCTTIGIKITLVFVLKDVINKSADPN